MSKSKDEPRDGSWARHKIAAELRWVRNNGGALDEKGGFNTYTWKALFRAKALGVAIGKSKDLSGATDGFSATYLVVESSMNRGTRHALIGLDLVADRARIKLRAASNAVDRVHRLGLWNKQERQGDDGEWTSNLYDFSEAKDVDVLGEEVTTVLHALKLITKSRTFDRIITHKNGEIVKETFKSRSPARMVVFVWVFDQIVLKQACARFTLNELCKGTGLKRRAAKAAIEGLLVDGTFVKVGEGAVSLCEAVGRFSSLVKRVDGPLWTEETLKRDRPAIGKRKSKSVPETAEVRVPQSADGGLPESADGMLESADGAFESADGYVFESADGVPESAEGVLESADILFADSPANKVLAEGIPPAAPSCSAALDVDDNVLPVPACASGVPEALPVQSSLLVDDDAEAREGSAALAYAGEPGQSSVEAMMLQPEADEEGLLKAAECEERAIFAANICMDFRHGEIAPPDISNRTLTSAFMRAMSDGILADSEPSGDELEVVALAASRQDPAIIFGILAEALLIRYEHGDRESTWSEIADTLAYVLARAKDEELVVVPRPTSAAVDELAQSRAEDAEADVTSNPEAKHAQPIV